MSFIGSKGGGAKPSDLKAAFLTRTLPAIGSYVELGKFTGTHTPLALDVSVVALGIAKRYIFTVGSTDPTDTWHRLFAIASTQAGTDDFDLLIYKNDTLSETTLRFVRLTGTLTGTFNVIIKYNLGTSFTALSGSGTIEAPDNKWPSTSISQFGNQVVIGEDEYLDSGSQKAKAILIGDVEPLPTLWTDAQLQIHSEGAPSHKMILGINASDGRGAIQVGRQGQDWRSLHLNGRGGTVGVGENASLSDYGELEIKANSSFVSPRSHIVFRNNTTPVSFTEGQFWKDGNNLFFYTGGQKYKVDITAV